MARSATGPKKRPVELLTSAEVAALLRECSTLAPTGIRNRALITIMYRGGLRVEEALDLRAAHINPRNGTVQILHGKGDKARIVSIDDGAMALVQRWMDARARLIPVPGPLFCTLHGTKLSDSYVRNLMHRLGRKAGIDKRVHPHALRHSHAAELAAEGVPVNVIQAQLGHSLLATTDTYLRHIAPSDVIAMGRNRPRFDLKDYQ
jgi:site-specific recombinase XerD